MLGRLFNTGEEFWLKMQADYDRFVSPENVVESRLAVTEISARPSSLAQALPLRPVPTPSASGSCPTPDEHAVTGFRSLDLGPWGQPIHGNGRSNIG
jgi:hypothetical protein